MRQSIRTSSERRIFLRILVAQVILPFAVFENVSVSEDFLAQLRVPNIQGQKVGSETPETFLPLPALTEAERLQAARALLAQLYLDPQTRLVDCPTSYLQRSFRLPYRMACDLADALERIGYWSSSNNNCRVLHSSCVT